MLIPLGFMFLVVFVLSVSITNGVDYMHENHPDYTGDDLFGEDENEK